MSMLNWRRDPAIERSIAISEQRIQDSERRTKQIESETEQLREQNARGRELLASMHALCLEDDSSSTPAPPTPSATAPFSP